MLKKLSHKRGQAISTEYILIFFAVIGAIIAMSVYVQRGLQARVRDAQRYMIDEASVAYGQNLNYQYEPYYGYVASNIAKSDTATIQLLPGGGTGIYRKNLDQTTAIETFSNQAAPKDAI